MFIWKGVNIFPMQIDSILMDIHEIGGTYLVVLETQSDVDAMTIQVEVGEAYLGGEKSESLRRRIIHSFQSELLVRPEVQLVPIGTIEVSEVGKENKVIDKRTL